MSNDAYAKYASRAERELDELYERHLDYLCDRATCSWCIADEVEQMSAYYDLQRRNELNHLQREYEERGCPHCETERVNNQDRCAYCGR